MNIPNDDFSIRDRAYHLHSFTDLSKYEKDGSIIIDHGEGIYLIDTDGKRYLDAMSSLWCVTLGYSEDRLAKAAYEQMTKLPYSHTFRGRSHPKLIELADKIVSLTPDHLTKVFFAGSGSEANESAIKMAWSYHKSMGAPEKRKVISRVNGYHGSTVFATSLSGMPSMHEFMNVQSPEVFYAACPNYLKEAQAGETEEEFSTRLVDDLEQQILSEGPETIAAFIAEPVMGVGGVILPPATYFEKIQKVLECYNILMIADEVICGFGRTGNMFGSVTFGITPDILTVAKGISSAYFPISAAIVSEKIYASLIKLTFEKGVFSHGFTYSGHPVGAAVALEAIKIVEEKDILSHVQSVGSYFQTELCSLNEYSIVANVRGVGLMAAFDLLQNTKDNTNFDASLSVGTLLMDIAETHHLFVRAVGDTIVIAPPLIITKEEVDELIIRIKRAFDDIIIELSILNVTS